METNNKETVKVEVVQPFRDKFDKSILYKVGQELEFEIARAEDVVTRGLAEYVYPVG
ncbi:hypothetical protein [Bacteroides fragilis]|uniref:Uncharacterized protein n=2 Tax=Bacteroides fragilis TaxID=817 RepID=A0AAP9NGS4_BACFG|nr:hypothetical protein [Bacteroides fragilis]EFR54606.1 hypothetical protein BFAG_03304 [Bacteroides fragilis 3_1_12]MBM6512206.1 hypothetical protein [Bacteroides fragilis]QKH87040.1 hypothetical protein FOC69_22920 [Bacteroides fragilis]